MKVMSLPPFMATVKWLKKAMRLRELDVSLIDDSDCWNELGKKKNLVPEKFLLEVRQALIDSGDGWPAINTFKTSTKRTRRWGKP